MSRKLILAGAIMLSTLTFAQPGAREKITPEQHIDKQMKEMTTSLNLSEKQQVEMRSILNEQSKIREARKAEMKTMREKGEKPTDAQKAEMKKQIIDEQLAFKTKMKKVLSEEQLKKMKELRQERGKEMFEKRKAARKDVKKPE